MKAAIIDASIAVKWVIPEDHSDACTRLLTEGSEMHVPGHWLAEVSSTLWAKSAVKHVLTREQAIARIEWIGALDMAVTPIHRLIQEAAELAFALHLTVYDTLYLALAKQIAVPVVTADRKFLEKTKSDQRFERLIVWVEQL